MSPNPASILPTTIREARSGDDMAFVVELLSQAFAGDPIMAFTQPEPSHVGRYFSSLVHKQYRPEGLCFVDDKRRAASIWLPPGVAVKTPGLAYGLGWLLAMSRPDRLGRLVATLGLARALSAAKPREPHYYLHAVGVLPEARGQGLGSALLRAVLDRCDQEGVAAYLENSNPRNDPLYTRHGFRSCGHFDLAPGGPRIGFMLRPVPR